MSRLLLVDDNPSIHKIAETLLGSSSIELVCAGSAQEALMMLDSGERFDVALLDTAMPPGMSGWELLDLMRKHPDSAFIPIAMMAGVLDEVDPERLRYAPIQGFLKKPIELRELAARVHQLLATPVTLAENEDSLESPSVLSPFSTVPGTKIKNLPEFRDAATGHPSGDLGLDDLLLLTPEDFWPSEAGETPMPSHSTLDLEELDLDALKDLHGDDISTQPEASFPPLLENLPEPAPAAPEVPAEVFESSAPTQHLLGEETLEIPGLAIHPHDLQDLGDAPDFENIGLESPHFEGHATVPPDAVPVSHEDSAFPSAAAFALPAALALPVAASVFALDHGHGELAHAGSALIEAPSTPPPATSTLQDAQVPTPTGDGHHAVVQAILADPAMMDALAKALVARLGDQALREIAWELMPELALKLPR